MKNNAEGGFSLIELLLVVVVIGIIAAMGIPAMQRGVRAAQNGTTFATLRSVASAQATYFSQNGRFGRLNEINSILGNGVGTVSGNTLTRNKFTMTMTPPAPTDLELKNGYTITATRNVNGEDTLYKYELTQAGDIQQILPVPVP